MTRITIPAVGQRAIRQAPLSRAALAMLCVGGTVALGQAAIGALRMVPALHSALAGNALAFLLVAPSAALAYHAYVRLVERRAVDELARDGALRELGAGAALGIGLFGAVLGILSLLGAYRVIGLDGGTAALAALLGALASGFIQELIFRGILFRIAQEALGTWAGLTLAALLFGLLHATSAGATAISTLAIALEAGLLLGAAYLLTGRLWLAIGLHVGWDFANDGLFGTGVAGATGAPLRGLLRGRLTGPAVVTGGAFGVETSVVAVVLLVAAGSVLILLARRRGRVVRARWKIHG